MKVSDSNADDDTANKDIASNSAHQQTVKGDVPDMSNRISVDADYKQRVREVIQNFLADCL